MLKVRTRFRAGAQVPLSVRIYYENIVRCLSSCVRFVDSGEDLVWDPNGVSGIPPEESLKSYGGPVVQTVHGTVSLSVPVEFLNRDAEKRKRVLRRNQYIVDTWKFWRHRISSVVTVSNFAKDEISENLGIPAEKIVVAYHGVDHGIFFPDERKLRSADTRRPTILHVSSSHPVKNVGVLVGAFERLRQEMPCDLVMVSPGAEQQNEACGQLITEPVDHGHLAAMYRGASVFVLPSVRESFGMALVEAIACGCPVITSNNSACKEVVGAAGIFIDPHSVESLVDGLKMVLTDSNRGARMRALGIERARHFT